MQNPRWAQQCLPPQYHVPDAALCVLSSCSRASASWDKTSSGNFLSRWIQWRFSGTIHLLVFFEFFSTNKLQYPYIANYDLIQTVPVSICYISTLIFRPFFIRPFFTSFSLISQGKIPLTNEPTHVFHNLWLQARQYGEDGVLWVLTTPQEQGAIKTEISSNSQVPLQVILKAFVTSSCSILHMHDLLAHSVRARLGLLISPNQGSFLNLDKIQQISHWHHQERVWVCVGGKRMCKTPKKADTRLIMWFQTKMLF